MDYPSGGPPLRRANDADLAACARRFGEALRVGDAKLAERVAEQAVIAGSGAAAVHSRVIGPAMEWIGELWERGAITVADEHLATAISHDVLARLFPRLLTTGPRSRGRVLLAAAEGEHHALGLQMVADVLEGGGFAVFYLGPDLPADALLDACRQHKPHVVGLSATMALNVPTLLRELVEVSNLDDPPLLMAGGRGLRQFTGLAVPVVATAENVVGAVEHLLANPHSGAPLSASLVERIPRVIGPGAGTDEVGTIADHFSAAALAAADTARDAARRTQQMEQLALRDELTGIWNRRAFEDRFAEMAEASADIVLMMIDVDDFKRINDTWGHDSGDAALREVAGLIVSRLRASDFAARYGGDEFVVLFPGASSARAVAEEIRAGVATTLGDRSITVSIGLAVFSGDSRMTGITADQALYRAKAGGRNRVAMASG